MKITVLGKSRHQSTQLGLTISSWWITSNCLLAPDLDLYEDRHGAFAPRCDGIKESLSVGIGFTAVPATILGTRQTATH